MKYLTRCYAQADAPPGFKRDRWVTFFAMFIGCAALATCSSRSWQLLLARLNFTTACSLPALTTAGHLSGNLRVREAYPACRDACTVAVQGAGCASSFRPRV